MPCVVDNFTCNFAVGIVAGASVAHSTFRQGGGGGLKDFKKFFMSFFFRFRCCLLKNCRLNCLITDFFPLNTDFHCSCKWKCCSF